MKDKTKLLIHRLSWITITLMIIFFPFIISAAQPKLKLVKESVSGEYLSSLEMTSIDITLEFNRPIKDGYATIKYYDSNNRLLSTNEEYFSSPYYESKTAESFLIYVSGDVDSYEIVSYNFNTEAPLSVIILHTLFLPLAIGFLIGSFLLSYKEYSYNDKKISVYAGWFHHTLRINDEKYDELNILIFFAPIKLTTTLDDESKVEATITLLNRIKVKVNDKLLNKITAK